jgi:hypothetical protein
MAAALARVPEWGPFYQGKSSSKRRTRLLLGVPKLSDTSKKIENPTENVGVFIGQPLFCTDANFILNICTSHFRNP